MNLEEALKEAQYLANRDNRCFTLAIDPDLGWGYFEPNSPRLRGLKPAFSVFPQRKIA